MKKMPKMEYWNTKAKKRASKAEDKGIVEFFRFQKHYFGSMNDWIKGFKDPRNEAQGRTLAGYTGWNGVIPF